MDDCNKVYQMRFPQKLWYLINQYTNAILWGQSRKTILLNYVVLHDYLRSANTIFKTSNISSFVRQLNLYGFRKVTSHLQDPMCNSSNPFIHEYIHEFFQFDKPELLNKIVRKHLVLKKNFKNEFLDHTVCYPMLSNPLQKARRAFRLALKAAAQDLYKNQVSSYNEPRDSGEDDEYIDISSLIIPTKDFSNNPMKDPISYSNLNAVPAEDINRQDTTETYNIKIEPLSISSNNMTNCSQQYLSIPQLNPDPIQTLEDGVELLAEFNINNNLNNKVTKMEKENDSLTVNCVLPSINSFQNDDNVEQNRSQFSPEEWEQLFNDIENRIPMQEDRTNLKDIYSQISKTLNILNGP